MEEIKGEMSLEDQPGTSSGNVVLSAEIKKKEYSWDINREMYHRELNLTNRIGWRGAHTSAEGFNQAFYGSRQAVEQLTEQFRHDKRGTSLNFNRVGDLLCSGCHQGEIVVWDWANQKRLHRHIPGPYGTIKGIKFLDSSAGLDIVCASEGSQVHRSLIPPSGGAVKSELLYTHDSVEELIVVPRSRFEVMTCGSHLKHFDIRTHVSTTLLRYGDETEQRHMPIFSIAHHPYAPEICIAGSDDVLRVYDKRNTSTFLAQKSPFRAEDTPFTWMCSVAYNHSGSEILVGYSHADIYLFNSRDWNADYLHKYEGRWNQSAGFSQFFGPKSEFVMTTNFGLYIIIWDRNTEAMIKQTSSKPISWIHALEPHPWLPVLASAEEEHAIKIWAPQGGTENGLDSMPKPS
ncbi:DDB1- and CUL4-associated factor 8-like protein 2 [Drosophila suzukii]|uniref:DDB1- and CUL4-associated factor 8-like protein 2 n=1 Tax=Drosophila suzukii TaxID=28584 RepID=A0AB39ZJ07_DROSZ